jgi:hypothetical protein
VWTHLSDTPLQFAQNLFRSYLLSPELYETYQEMSPERMTANTDRTQIVRVDGESLSENWIPQETSLRRRTILIENQEHRRRKLALHNDPFAFPGPRWHCHCDGSERFVAK